MSTVGIKLKLRMYLNVFMASGYIRSLVGDGLINIPFVKLFLSNTVRGDVIAKSYLVHILLVFGITDIVFPRRS